MTGTNLNELLDDAYPEMQAEFALRWYSSVNRPIREFTPDYNIPVMDVQLQNCSRFNQDLKELVLEKEEEITEEYEPGSDGNTDLDDSHLTKRFEHFNVFEWDHPAVKRLFYIEREAHDRMLGHPDLQIDHGWPVQIQCWANALRSGETIDEHSHSGDGPMYLSANYCVTAEPDTATVYCPMGEEGRHIAIENRPGRLYMFPSWVPHFTTPYKRDEGVRITIAADMNMGSQDLVVRRDEEGRKVRQFIPFDHPPGVREKVLEQRAQAQQSESGSHDESM